MSIRTAKFASALFVGLLAGTIFTTTSQSAVNDCLSGPKDKTPDGSHWYYRIDRVTKRHCWYLRGEVGKPLQIAGSNVPSSAAPTLPEEATMQPSIADARAALPPQNRVKQDLKQQNNLSAEKTVTAAMPSDAGIESERPPSNRDAILQPSVIASRWPGESEVNLAPDPAPNKGNRAARANTTLQAQPPTALAAARQAAGELWSQISAYSLSARLAILMAALALAGMIANLMIKPGGPRRRRQAKVRIRRGPIWEPTDDDRIVLSAPPDADVPWRRTGHAPGDRERTAEFFSRLSRRAPA